jgi:hypothetical protein
MPVSKLVSKAINAMTQDESNPTASQHARDAISARLPLSLRRSRREAAALIRNQLKIGQAIRNQRIGSLWDLEQARIEKQEWALRTGDLLLELFSDDTLANQCNDWIGTILPEYAELDLFIEQFEQELKHRLGRLQEVLKMLDNIPEPSATIADAMARQAATEAAREANEARAPKAVLTSSAPAESEPAPAAAAASAPQSAAPAAAQAPAHQASSRQSATSARQQPQQQQQQEPPPPQQHFAVAAAAMAAHGRSTAQRSAAPATNALALILHGAVDAAKRENVSKLLEKLGLTASVIERVSAQTFPMDALMIDARGCAIVLLGDAASSENGSSDQNNGAANGSNPSATTEGDLLFVLGCCVGRFAAGRVCVLQASADAQQQQRSDQAIARTGLSPLLVDNTEGWKLQLARQLKAAGVTVDLNRLV